MDPTKEQIMKAACYLFTIKKYKDVTVKQISELSEITYGTVYSHFSGGKDDILNEVASVVIDDFFQIIEIDPNVKTIPDIRVAIYNNMMKSFSIVDENKVIMRVFWEAKGQSEIVHFHFQTLKDQFTQRIMCDIEHDQEQGLAQTDNPYLTSKALMHMVWNFVWDYVIGEENNAEEIAETIVEMYINSVYQTVR